MQNVSKLEVEKRRFHLTLSCTDVFFWKLYKGKDKVKKTQWMEIKRTGIILEIQDYWNVGKFLSAVKHKETMTVMLHVPIKHVPNSSLQLVYIILQVSPLMFIPLQCIHLNSKSIHTTMKSFQSENSGFMQFLHLTCPYPPLCLFNRPA